MADSEGYKKADTVTDPFTMDLATRTSTMSALHDEQKWLAKQKKQFVKQKNESLAKITTEMSTFPTKQERDHFAPVFADSLLSAYNLLSTGKLDTAIDHLEPLLAHMKHYRTELKKPEYQKGVTQVMKTYMDVLDRLPRTKSLDVEAASRYANDTQSKLNEYFQKIAQPASGDRGKHGAGGKIRQGLDEDLDLGEDEDDEAAAVPEAPEKKLSKAEAKKAKKAKPSKTKKAPAKADVFDFEGSDVESKRKTKVPAPGGKPAKVNVKEENIEDKKLAATTSSPVGKRGVSPSGDTDDDESAKKATPSLVPNSRTLRSKANGEAKPSPASSSATTSRSKRGRDAATALTTQSPVPSKKQRK